MEYGAALSGSETGEKPFFKRDSGIRPSVNTPGRQCGGLSASEDLYRTGHVPEDQLIGNTPHSSG